MPHTKKPKDSSPKRDANPHSSINGRLGKQTCKPEQLSVPVRSSPQSVVMVPGDPPQIPFACGGFVHRVMSEVVASPAWGSPNHLCGLFRAGRKKCGVMDVSIVFSCSTANRGRLPGAVVVVVVVTMMMTIVTYLPSSLLCYCWYSSYC